MKLKPVLTELTIPKVLFRLSESGLNILNKMFGESARSVVKRSKMRT